MPSRCTCRQGDVRCSMQSGHGGNHHGYRTVSTVEHYENFSIGESTTEDVTWSTKPTRRGRQAKGGDRG